MISMYSAFYKDLQSERSKYIADRSINLHNNSLRSFSILALLASEFVGGESIVVEVVDVENCPCSKQLRYCMKQIMLKSESLICKFASTDDVHLFIFLRNYTKIICFVCVVSAHLEILESKCQTLFLTCYWVKSIQTSIFKAHLCQFCLLMSSVFLHHCCCEMFVAFIIISQRYSFFFLSYWFWRNYLTEVRVVCLGERGQLMGI